MIGVHSSGILAIPHLRAFLSDDIADIRGVKNVLTPVDAIAGWGRKPSYYKAKRIAARKQVRLLTLEDGFIRSMGLGGQSAPLSIVIDDAGIYFDAFQSSRLEQLIMSESDDTADEQRAIQAIALIKQYQLSKYNHAPILHLNTADKKLNVLIVDQSMNDQSIRFSGASSASFQQMLQSAISTYPEATIWIKQHPDVVAKKRKGHFADIKSFPHADIRFINENANPVHLISQMDSVYVVSSHMGFEALMLGKKVHCFGVPWYAGWGLTDDQFAPVDIVYNRRKQKKTVTQLFSAAYFSYAVYIDPVSGAKCTLEQLIDVLARQKRWQAQFRHQVNAIGFSPWKKTFLREYLQVPGRTTHFLKRLPKSPNADHSYVVWGNKNRQQVAGYKAAGAHLFKVEDGFIRSVGLGANLIRPLSLVFDEVGIYYDPATPSALEDMLNHISLSEMQFQRAEALRCQIIAANLSKYNIGQTKPAIKGKTGCKVIMVPGQVEDDASVQLGCQGVKTNLDLLLAVREANPEAWIIYKPHPDVEAGLRPGVIPACVLQRCANEVACNMDLPSCVALADEVHTMTSLTGFEALLRGKTVYCYGMPFYAGWGLTYDFLQCERRQRKLKLGELIYAVLVSYPVYRLPDTEYLATVEQVIDYIVNERKKLQVVNHNKSLLARLRALAIYKR
jgi:capsular polysaccharide export protein